MNVPIFQNQSIRVRYKTTENIVLQLRGQVRLLNGDVVDIVEQKTITGVTSGTVTSGSFNKPVPAGEIITLTIKTITSEIRRGQAFLRGDLIYTEESFETTGLFAKYITSETAIGLGQFENSLDGKGYQYLLADNTLNDLSIGENKAIKIRSAIIYYLNGSVGDQLFQFVIERGGELMFRTQCKFVHPTAVDYTYCGFIGNGDNFPAIQAALGAVTTFCLPDILLKNGDTIIISPINADPTDSMERRIAFEQWISE